MSRLVPTHPTSPLTPLTQMSVLPPNDLEYYPIPSKPLVLLVLLMVIPGLPQPQSLSEPLPLQSTQVVL